MIKGIALGVVCLAGLAVMAAATKRSAPPSAEIVMPVEVAGNKADRLPLAIHREAPSVAEQVVIGYAEPSEQKQEGLPSPAPKEAVTSPRPDFIPRHWHDPQDPKARAANKGAGSTKHLQRGASDNPPKRISDLKQCRSDGLDPLLRKLNLSPPCDS